MEQQLIACARELFEGVPGSAQQKDANAWLMAFQTRDEAWQPALHVLQHPPRVHDHLNRSNMVATGRGQVLAAPVLVAMQIVRLKTVQEWTRMTGEQRQFVRNTLLSLLGVACTNDKSVLTPAAFRIACVIIADIIVKSSREWSTWKHDLQQVVDASLAQKSVMGAIMYEEVLASIPQQIVASMHLWTSDELQEVIASFKQEQEHVMYFARTVLSSIPDAQSNALRCIESWLVGCIATHDDFGLDAITLFTGGILDPLLSVATCENEDMAQLAAEIVADALASISPELAGGTIIEVVCYTAHRLLQTRPLIFGQATTITSGLEDTDEAPQTTICRGLSRIACSLAINHTATLLSREMNEAMTRMDFDATQDSFSSAFLEYLLGCSSHKDIEVMEPTLEFWFFFLDQSTKSGSLWHLLTSVTEQEHVVQLLGRLVNALIDHCRYPQWFVETQELTSDDADVEAIAAIRRDIADTLLSLFSKWPGLHGEPNGNYHACVKGMIDLLYTSTDIALADATLFLLEYMIELFDIDSSDSESDSELELVARSGEGILLLQSVLTSAHTLPNHPLIMNGIARYLRSLSAAVVLPSDVYLQASLNLCRGLNFAASFAVVAQALLQNSNSISKYTEVSERAELLQTLLTVSSTSPTPDVSISARGDLLEATFRTMGGISNADFANFCNAVLTSITTSMQSSHADECASAIALLGRAISGVQAPEQALALIDQIWRLVGASIARHQADASCRDGAVQLFLNVAPVLDAHHVHIQREILDLCLRWYPESFAGEILKCCIAIVTKEKANAEFEATVEQIIPTLFIVFRQKVRDVPVEDLDAGERNIAAFCENHRNVALASQEIIQFMQLIRQVRQCFPQVLIQPRAPHQVSLFWHSLRLTSILLETDHQVQEISDAACDLILDGCSASQESCVREMEQFTTSITRGVLSYFGPKRVHYRQRNLWEFLFQVLHSPRVPSHIQGLFRAALSACVFESTALRDCLSLDALHDVQAEMLALRQRHRFRQYVTQLARHIEALEGPK